MTAPDLSTLAQAAEASYNSHDAPEHYDRVAEHSTPDVSTYRHKVNPHYIIAHRGTDLSGSKDSVGKDLRQDLRILIGDKSNTDFLKDRTAHTEKVVNAIKLKEPKSMIHLTGHSLGGHSAQQAMIDSHDVRNKIDSADTFNTGASPFKLGEPMNKKTEAYKTIAKKTTHHVIEGDDISAGIHHHAIGKIKTYEGTAQPTIADKLLSYIKPLAQKSKLGKLAHLGAKRILKTLQSHSLSNFI